MGVLRFGGNGNFCRLEDSIDTTALWCNLIEAFKKKVRKNYVLYLENVFDAMVMCAGNNCNIPSTHLFAVENKAIFLCFAKFRQKIQVKIQETKSKVVNLK